MEDKDKTKAELLNELKELRDENESLKAFFEKDRKERKQIEDKLIIFSQAVEQSSASIVITDLNGNIEYANPKVTETTGYTFEELKGKNPRILSSGELPKEEYKALWEAINSGNDWLGEFHNKRKDGVLYWESALITPIKNADGKFFHFLAVKEDITNRKKAEALLKESEEQYRILFETAQEAIIVTQGSKLVFFNPSLLKITGYSKTDLLEIDFIDFVYPDDRNLVLTNREKRLAGKSFEEKYQFRLIRKDQSLRWVEISGVKLDWKGNSATLNFINDITEQKLAELELKNLNEDLMDSKSIIEENLYQTNLLIEELSETKEKLTNLNAAKDKFFSIISHDLRSPFNGFLNMTEMMANGDGDFSKDELLEIGKAMYQSTSNLYKLIENLLDWARMQNGQVDYNPTKISIYGITKQSINTINQRAGQKGITVNNEVSKELTVIADEKMIFAILRNLISNAVKFTRHGGEVIIASDFTNDEETVISVKDTGVGISDTNVGRLFRIDEKIKSIGTDGEPSTGLGLLLCKEFIEKHNGRIWVESQEGKGSTFYFSLPKAI